MVVEDSWSERVEVVLHSINLGSTSGCLDSAGSKIPFEKRVQELRL